jgi:hypothetical protein
MAQRKHRIEPTRALSTSRVVLPVQRATVRVAVDLFANAALRWLCRGHAPSGLRILAVTR